MNKDEIVNERIRQYVNKTYEYYDIYEKSFLKNLDMDLIRRYKDDMPDIARQVLEEIGYYDDKKEKSGYEAFITLLDREFGLNKNITEVGGGVVPTLGYKISLRQNGGSITIYDPRLIDYHQQHENFILKKEKFYRNTDTSNSDMLIGFMPCEATQAIIENATDNNIDFMIAMCEGGPHGDEFDYFDSIEEWISCMLYIAERKMEEQDMGELKVLSFKKYGSPYPLIYNKREQ